MTTIAYDGEILAADSQLTIGDVKVLSDDKIVVVNSEMIFAGAGEDHALQKLRRFYSQPNWIELLASNQLPEIKKDTEALIFFRGEMYIADHLFCFEKLAHPHYAVGSGWSFALAAMALGKNAIEAVEFASQFDIYTNDKVRWINVKDFQRNSTGKTQRASRNRKGTPRVEENQKAP